MEWTEEDVKLLGRNRTLLVNGTLSCQLVPSESDLVKFRSAPQKFIDIMSWLSLGTKENMAILNKFKRVESDSQGIIYDKESLHEVNVSWNKKKLSLSTTKFDSYTIKKIPIRDIAIVWMVYEKQARYPDNEPALIWITDWKNHQVYQKDAYASDAFDGGELSSIADVISKFNDMGEFSEWH